jgi:hypothetical protein
VCWPLQQSRAGKKGGHSQNAERTNGGFNATTRASRRTTPAKPAAGEPSLGDRVLALPTGKTQQEIAAACKGARPNHVGVVIARHKRVGRIEERQGRLYAIFSTGTEQRAAV